MTIKEAIKKEIEKVPEERLEGAVPACQLIYSAKKVQAQDEVDVQTKTNQDPRTQGFRASWF